MRFLTRISFFSWILLGLVNPVNGQIFRDTVWIETEGSDAHVSSAASTTNYGTDQTMHVDWDGPTGSARRNFIKADFSYIPTNAIILSASIKMYAYAVKNTVNHPMYVSRVLTSWDESSITWANKPNTTAVNRVSVSHSSTSSTGWQTMSITTLAKYAVSYPSLNFGWEIALQTESGGSSNGVNYSSSDNTTAARRPYILVDYMLPIEMAVQVTHCTPGNDDGELLVDVTGGTHIQTSYFRIDKVDRDTTELGAADLTNVTSGSSVSYNATTKQFTAEDLEPGVYRIYVNDSMYYAASDIKYRFYEYFLVGREGDTTSGILLPSVTL